MNRKYFELHRKINDGVYQFDKKEFKDGIPGFCRRDQDLWITYRKGLGWVAYDEKTGDIQGIPWGVKIENQSQHNPPEGLWVSRKGDKSYVYDLKYFVES